jgi:hypothetical protein
MYDSLVTQIREFKNQRLRLHKKKSRKLRIVKLIPYAVFAHYILHDLMILNSPERCINYFYFFFLYKDVAVLIFHKH